MDELLKFVGDLLGNYLFWLWVWAGGTALAGVAMAWIAIAGSTDDDDAIPPITDATLLVVAATVMFANNS